MKILPFTLVLQPDVRKAQPNEEKGPTPLAVVKLRKPTLARRLQKFAPNLNAALLNSAFTNGLTGAHANDSIETLSSVIEDLERQPKVTKVGLWDLGARAGFLPQLLIELNATQPAFTFFNIQAPTPAGLISRPEVVATMVAKWGHPLTKEEINNNIIANDFFKFGETVRRKLGVDYLVGLTPKMIAEDDGDMVIWNFFSSFKQKKIIVSTYELRSYAEEAGRPYEVAIMQLVLIQLLVAESRQLEFHDRDVGCIFDANVQRVNAVLTIKNLMVEQRCLKLVAKKYREVTLQLLNTLRNYTREK